MKESIVKLTLALIALAGLATGGVFLLIPQWYVALSAAEPENVAWLRILGAAIFSVQGLGLLVATFRRRDTNPIILLVALASTAETAAGLYSLFTGEFSGNAQWAIIVPLLFAATASILLWFIWVSRRRSRMGTEPVGGQTVSGSHQGSVSDQSAAYPGDDYPPGNSSDEFAQDTLQDPDGK